MSDLHIDVLNKPCLICGLLNRFHKVFYCADNNYYVKQTIDMNWNNEPLVTDHHACVDNLDYLTRKYDHSIINR